MSNANILTKNIKVNLAELQDFCAKATKMNADCCLVSMLDGFSVDAVSFLLAKRSIFFCDRLPAKPTPNNKTIIRVPVFSGFILKCIVEYCTEGRLTLNEETVSDLLTAALALGMVDVELECKRYIKELFIDHNLAMLEYESFFKAEKYNALNNRAKVFIVNNFNKMCFELEKRYPQIVKQNISSEVVKTVANEEIGAKKEVAAKSQKALPYNTSILELRKVYSRIFSPLDNDWVSIKTFPKFDYDIVFVETINNEFIIVVGKKNEKEMIIEQIPLKTLKKKLLYTEEKSRFLANYSMAASENNLYFVGGPTVLTIETFNLKTKLIWKLSERKLARPKARTVLLQNRLFVVGGEVNGAVSLLVEYYDLLSHSWYSCGSTMMPHTEFLLKASNTYIFIVDSQKDTMCIERFEVVSQRSEIYNDCKATFFYNETSLGIMNDQLFILTECNDTKSIILLMFDQNLQVFRKMYFSANVNIVKNLPKVKNISAFTL